MKTSLIPGVRLTNTLPPSQIKKYSLTKYVSFDYIFKIYKDKNYDEETMLSIGVVDKNLNFNVKRMFILSEKVNQRRIYKEVEISQ